MPDSVCSLKPSAVMVRLYRPIGRKLNVNSPAVLVVAVCNRSGLFIDDDDRGACDLSAGTVGHAAVDGRCSDLRVDNRRG